MNSYLPQLKKVRDAYLNGASFMRANPDAEPTSVNDAANAFVCDMECYQHGDARPSDSNGHYPDCAVNLLLQHARVLDADFRERS